VVDVGVNFSQLAVGTPVTPKMKATALELELERLDQYQASQHQDAINGDRDAIAMCLQIAELRADFLGTRAPASLRIDPVQLMEQAQPQKTSTERIKEAIDRIRAESGRPALDWDGPPSSSELDPEPNR
jgi:hypothetical protein